MKTQKEMEKKKIKVVSMYPNTPFKIGDILEYRNIYGPEYVSPRTGNTIGILVVEEHPNIFKDVNNRGLVEIIKRILRINFDFLKKIDIKKKGV